MLNGWTTRTATELDATIRTWAVTFNRYHIPLDAYDELYDLVFDYRQSRLRERGEKLDADATLVVACWDGEYGLRNRRRRERVNEHRYLPDATAGDCLHCFGTGMWNPDGKGLRNGCTHEAEA